VKVPPGVKEGFKIRMKGEGEPGTSGAPSGDLYLIVKIKSNSVFDLKDGNLYCEVPVTVSEAALGGEIDVPTLRGSISMKIPSKTQTGKIFRLKEQGFPSFNNKEKNGDFFIKIKIVLPEPIGDEEIKLYEEIKKFPHENPRQKLFSRR
jgi:DnaJ-class molecular chaperone